jgi:hypothetical protein
VAHGLAVDEANQNRDPRQTAEKESANRRRQLPLRDLLCREVDGLCDGEVI